MRNVNRAYTVALVGDPATSELGPFIAAVAESISSFGTVVSGDYLKKENLSDKSRLFHIGCYCDDLLVDVVHCPLTFKHFSVAVAQAGRLVWVIRPDQILRNHRCALQIARALAVPSAVLVCNTGGMDNEYVADQEMYALLKEEAEQLLEGAQLTPDLCVDVCVASGGDNTRQNSELMGFAHYLCDQSRLPESPELDQTLMFVEQCYGVKGPGGKPARVAYGAVRGKSLAVGELLNSPMLEEGANTFRVSEIQQFGQNLREVHAGSSASLMFHGAPKDQPRAGQILVGGPSEVEVQDTLRLEVSVLAGETVGQIVGAVPSIELATGPTHVSARVLQLTEMPDDQSRGVLHVKTSHAVAVFQGQQVLLGRESEILAWGNVDGNVETC